MKLKKEYIILAVIIVALTLYLVLHQTDRTHYQLPVFPEVAKKNITRLEISTSGQTLVLKKKDATWYIDPENYAADSEKVKPMLNVVESLNVTALVSESKNYFRYDLGDDKKIIVKAWSGDTLSREFEIGKSATTSRHTFVKLEGNPNVYHAQGNFRNTFDQTVDKLRDKTVLAFEENDIREIHILKDKKTTVIGQLERPVEDPGKKDPDAKSPAIIKTEPLWQTTDGKNVAEPIVRRLFSTLSGMKCETFINDRKKEDFKDPGFGVTLKGSEEYFVFIFKHTDKEAKNHPAISSENDYPFLLSASQVENIEKMIQEILKTSAKP